MLRNYAAIWTLGGQGHGHDIGQQMTGTPLQKEIETYNAKLPELLGSIGKFVLIKGTEVEGVYDTYADALKIGYERFKLEPFMVKQIAPAEQISVLYARA